MITYDDVRRDEEVLAFLKKGDANLEVLGYTEHAEAHCGFVAHRAAYILRTFGYGEREVELAMIAGFMHDIGNSVNRKSHAEYGALLANDILKRMDISLEDRVTVVSAIGNHDESTGGAQDPVSAALIIADKTDVRRNRVRESADFDIHDRVNYAVMDTNLSIDMEKKIIALDLNIDESICSMYEYFDIFLGRMMMCKKAAEKLGAKFRLTANGSKIL
ncbi:MAG: HD domain-containing protein [Lachnospiraceae bacterium]|nr:HD domain-containing protein [Lachnospiraceae bacterium]